jgi:solute carrier family 25 (mitochondrial folate transporter), member 32
LKGFFKGAKIAVVTIPIFYSLYFPIYENLKRFFSLLIYKKENNFNSIIYTLSSASSALICDVITNPMWIVRIRKQTEFIHSGCQKMDSFNVVKEIRNLYKNVK